MSVTDEFVAASNDYAADGHPGSQPLPPAKQVAVTGQRPHWAAERSETSRPTYASRCSGCATLPFIPHTDQVRGFVYDVLTGKVSEVA